MNSNWFKFNLLAVAGLAAVTSACSLGEGGGGPAAQPDAGPPPPDARFVPPPDPILPTPEYKRASLKPAYQITPTGEFGRFNIFGKTMNNNDFSFAGAKGASVAQKMGQIQNQLASERGVPPAEVDPFIDFDNEDRAGLIPFRGNPTDVKFMEFDGKRKAFVPLGGDVTSVGNEVAIVDLDNNVVKRVQVGIHPQRVFADANTGLVWVCNQFSNYISIIDSRTDDLLRGTDDLPIEVPTEFDCTDILVVERANFGEENEIFVYVANSIRSSVMRYKIDVLRDGNDDVDDIDILAPDPNNPHIPDLEILGVGRNPLRLAINEENEDELYVANGKGGEMSTVRIPSGEVVELKQFRAPTMDAVTINDKTFIATTTPYRGYPNDEAQIPEDIQTSPIEDADGNVVHPGAQFDDTDSYNFEDVRNGIFEIDRDLGNREAYMTDDNEADDLFIDQQKVMAGAVPLDIARNEAGNRVYVAYRGSDLVQEFSVVANGNFRLRDDGNLYQTGELPQALTLDEEGGVLLVVNFGADNLQVFDLDNANLIQEFDLGYAVPKYPSTTMELGEYTYATAKWANDGRKSCEGCHTDKGSIDGIDYGNGATASTMPHQVKPNYNLLTTDNYFWNGSFVNNSYASLAFAAQSRTQCELILFGLVEGVDSIPAQRVGDPVNFTSDAATDAICRPNTAALDDAGLPSSLQGDTNGDGVADFLDIADVINDQKQVAFAQTGLSVQDQLLNIGRFDANNGQANRDEISRAMDFYGAAELRLPPNVLGQMKQLNMLHPEVADKITKGETVFLNAGCGGCHTPTNAEAPFADFKDHGRGAEFFREFIREYGQDPQIVDIGGIPQAMQDSAARPTGTTEINYHDDDQDGFQPFAFDENVQLRFENPLAADGAVEDARLKRIVLINLADPDRGFIPGNVIGQPRVNTPSLRGVWQQYNYLRHGLALSVREAILAPGHPALKGGEQGFAIDRFGKIDVHGNTSTLNADQVEQLEFYLRSIE